MGTRRHFLRQIGSGTLALATPGRAHCAPVPHSLLTGDPAASPLDLWGWHTSPFYQRRGGRVVSPGYIKQRAVAESYKWGANLVELYRGGYPLEQRAGWTRESTADLHRYIHDLDMLLQWFPHRLDDDGAPQANLISHWAQGSGVASNSFPGAIEAMRSLARTQFDSLVVPVEELFDVLGTEQWPVMHALLFNQCMWPYNPAASFYTDNHAFDETLPNEIDVTASNGTGADDQTSGYHKLPGGIRKEYGFQFSASQAECRSELSENRFGGLGQPDWVLKQVNDQFRERARGTRTVSPSAVWWINEAEDMCPERNRRYVYGISQDPIRCAVAATLAGLGEGGVRVETGRGIRGLAQRYPYPSRTAFLQNNYLCVFALHDRDRFLLWRDPERLAHYDNDSHSELVCDPVCQTVAAGDEAPEVKTVEFEYMEPAGYKSVWRSRFHFVCDGSAVEETRTATMISDTPYVRIRVERAARGGAVALGARFGLPHYDRLLISGEEHARAAEAAVPDVLTLKDSQRQHPDLVLMLLSKGRLRRVRWLAGQTLTLESEPGERESFEFALLVPEGLYEGSALEALRRGLMAPEQVVTLDAAGGAAIGNQLGVPLVKVVRVRGAGPHPYQVYEFGRWVFRGAQPSVLHPGEDYLKCYLPPRGSARIQRYGYADDVARPGWGCQYTMALSECSRGRVVAEVRGVTSFLFAPRVRFKTAVSEVRMDGKPWCYFDGCHVFLPNRRGRYRIEVVEGAAEAPHLARTFAHIESCSWAKERLSFDARLPEWVDGVPEDFEFAALVRHPGRHLVALDRARLLRSAAGASIVGFKPGAVSLEFAASPGAARVAEANLDIAIERHLGRRSTRMLRPYLKPFQANEVRIGDPGARRAMARDYDCLVWNSYCLEALPRDLAGEDVDALREHVSRGGGLFLLANAVRLVPRFTGADTGDFKTLHIGHHLDEDCRALGLEIAAGGHSIFEGLQRSGDNTASLLEPHSSDIFKRVLWPAGSGSVLAHMHAEFKAGRGSSDPIFERSAVLCEWRIGKGAVIGCGFGLRYTLGSPNRWTPSANALRLVENVVRYLGGARNAKVGVLTLPPASLMP